MKNEKPFTLFKFLNQLSMKTIQKTLLLIVFSMATTLMFSQPVNPRCPGHPTCNDGGGGNDPIICHWPMTGNIPNKSITFRWEPVRDANTYFFTLFDKRAKKLFEDTTSNLGVVLDLPSLELTIGEQYVITVNSDNDRKSNTHRFTLRDRNDFGNALIELESDVRFRSLNGVEKLLRKSDFLHEKGWNLAAVKAHNIQTDNLVDIIKIANHFEELRIKLDPPLTGM